MQELLCFMPSVIIKIYISELSTMSRTFSEVISKVEVGGACKLLRMRSKLQLQQLQA